MSDTTDEETPEAEAPEVEQSFRVRDVFQFRRQPKPEEPQPEGGPKAPPPPDHAPAAPVGRSDGGHHFPNWWEPKAPLSSDGGDMDHRARSAAGTVKWINGVPHDVPPTPETCKHRAPHEVRAKPTDQLVAYWCSECETQLDIPDDYDELEDDDAEEGDGEDADKVPAKIRHRWSVRGSSRKEYSRPKYRGSGKKEEKKSMIDAWQGMRPVTRHGLYNATALGVGFFLGVPQFFTAETEYLVVTYGSWTDFYVCIWYGVAIGIWMVDHRTRNWLPPFALLGRMPLVSMVVGVLLHGNPV